MYEDAVSFRAAVVTVWLPLIHNHCWSPGYDPHVPLVGIEPTHLVP